MSYNGKLALAFAAGAVVGLGVAAVARMKELERINAAVAAGRYLPNTSTFGGAQQT